MTTSVKTHEVLGLPLPEAQQDWLKSTIRDVPDFPKAGIVFKDLTTLMKDPIAFKLVLNALTFHCATLKPTMIVDSGHGYHAYWKLKEAQTDAGLIESCLKGIANAVNADRGGI